MKRKVIKGGVWDTEVHFLCGTAEEINAYFKREYGEKKRLGKATVGNHCMWKPDDPKNHTRHIVSIARDRCNGISERRAVLVHEVTHCVGSMLSRKGIRYDATNDEPFAYTIEWLYREGESVLR